MKKNIKVILKQDLINSGRKNEIIAVKRGYALNYLIPKRIAQFATEGQVKQTKMFREITLKQKEININKAKNTKEKVEKIKKVTLYRITGKDNLIFGNIKDKDIINTINQKCNLELDRNQIEIPIIKNIGIYEIKLQIFQDIKVKLKLQVVPKDT